VTGHHWSPKRTTHVLSMCQAIVLCKFYFSSFFSPLRKIILNHSLNHPAYLMCREPKLLLWNIQIYYFYA